MKRRFFFFYPFLDFCNVSLCYSILSIKKEKVLWLPLISDCKISYLSLMTLSSLKITLPKSSGEGRNSNYCCFFHVLFLTKTERQFLKLNLYLVSRFKKKFFCYFQLHLAHFTAYALEMVVKYCHLVHMVKAKYGSSRHQAFADSGFKYLFSSKLFLLCFFLLPLIEFIFLAPYPKCCKAALS